MESILVTGRTICLPFSDEKHYATCMEDGEAFRRFLTEAYASHPELFPKHMAQGFILHGFTPPSGKQGGFRMRRIKLSGGDAYQIRPSFMMPYLIAKTDEVEKGLFFRRWGVPFDALAYGFGHDAMFWYRASVGLGRNSIVGTTVKDPEKMPEHLAADEKHTRFNAEKAYVTTTVANGCILGAGLSENAGVEALTKSYGHFREEARNVKPDYQPKSVNTDGWEHTQRAWKALFAGITVILCFLHAFLGIRDRCKRDKPLLDSISDKVWSIYHAVTPTQFSQRIRRLREWAKDNIPPGPVQEKVIALCAKAPEFKKAFSHPGCHRTSNAVDRLMNHQDRLLYSMQYFHGTRLSALLQIRAMALIWNFHPYSSRARHKDLINRASPFEELNGFHYHPNWLQNMLVAASLGGWKV